MNTYFAGNYINQGSYKSFQPTKINRKWQLDDMELLQMLSKADRQIGRLDMHSEFVPNIDLFISMHVAKEATQSSKIEGTQTNMEDAFKNKEDIPLDQRDDWEEVQNYIKAMNEAVYQLSSIPFSARLIRDTHKLLMTGVRGEHKYPGNFRSSQNWIGGSSIRDAVFIPPTHHEVPELISDLEKFVHNEQILLPDLIKVAIMHYQFETIHPFLDGNGRVGRLLITLYLVSKGILKKPLLYLSDYFEKNRGEYYRYLTLVRTENNLKLWLKFFLKGVIETAGNSVETLNQVLKLKDETNQKLEGLGSRSGKARLLIDNMYQKPIIDASEAMKITGNSTATVYDLLRKLEEMKILKEITGGQRNRIFMYHAYFDIFR